jgi:hypothetical protein
MSLDSWKKEFYKTPAYEVSKRFALKHSLRKWRGLLYRNRKKHNVKFSGLEIYDDDDGLTIDDESCALCQHYLHKECKKCPLGSCSKEYGLALDHRKVVPMIRLLEKAIKNQKAYKTKKKKQI